MDWSTPHADCDITYWEVLNIRVLHSCLDSPLDCLGFSGDGHNHTTRAVSCLFLVFIPICFLAFSRPRTRKDGDIHTRAALRALLTIVTPTCSLWPSRYVKLASIRRSRVDIPLEMIIEDTTDGVIELRDPVNDLVDLISLGATARGHFICITIAWKWWINYFEWWMFAKSKSDYPTLHSPGYILGLSDWLNDNTHTVNSSPLGLFSSPFALTSSASCPLLCLDYLPHSIIPSLNAGCKVILEFTAFSPSLRTLSATHVISAIPFIISGRSPRRPRTLISVLKQLSASCSPNLVVDSVSNVSADYEHTLRRMYGSFSREQKIREMWVKSLGIKTWRRDMFLVAFEAALLHRGWIERWAIQVTTK